MTENGLFYRCSSTSFIFVRKKSNRPLLFVLKQLQKMHLFFLWILNLRLSFKIRPPARVQREIRKEALQNRTTAKFIVARLILTLLSNLLCFCSQLWPGVHYRSIPRFSSGGCCLRRGSHGE